MEKNLRGAAKKEARKEGEKKSNISWNRKKKGGGLSSWMKCRGRAEGLGGKTRWSIGSGDGKGQEVERYHIFSFKSTEKSKRGRGPPEGPRRVGEIVKPGAGGQARTAARHLLIGFGLKKQGPVPRVLVPLKMQMKGKETQQQRGKSICTRG